MYRRVSMIAVWFGPRFARAILEPIFLRIQELIKPVRHIDGIKNSEKDEQIEPDGLPQRALPAKQQAEEGTRVRDCHGL